MSGGKGGGSRTSTTEMPVWMRPYAKRNLERAETAQKIGYQPYFGPDIAAFNPTQEAAFNANIGAAEAFGLVPRGSITAMQDMAPQPQTFEGGLRAYSSAPLYEQALAEYQSRMPGQSAQYNKLFVDPYNQPDQANSGYASPNNPTPGYGPDGMSLNPIGYIAPVAGSGFAWDQRNQRIMNGSWIPYGWDLIGEGKKMLIKTMESGLTSDYDPDTGEWIHYYNNQNPRKY